MTVRRVFCVICVAVCLLSAIYDGDTSGQDNPARGAAARTQQAIEQFRQGTRADLIRRAEDMQLVCGLTPAQFRQLEVAAAGVSLRMFAELKEEAAKLETEPAVGVNAGRQATALVQQANSIWKTADEHPLWQTSVSRTLTADQTEVLTRDERKRREFREQVWVYRVVDEIERQARVLRVQQREDLIADFSTWVAENGIPKTAVNPRNRSLIGTLPPAARRLILNRLEDDQLRRLR